MNLETMPKVQDAANTAPANALADLPLWDELELKEMPDTYISHHQEVHDALTHYLNTVTDFEEVTGQDEAHDRVLWLSVQRAFHAGEDALKAAIDAHCAHAVARTLLLDRKRRKEK